MSPAAAGVPMMPCRVPGHEELMWGWVSDQRVPICSYPGGIAKPSRRPYAQHGTGSRREADRVLTDQTVGVFGCCCCRRHF